MAGLFMHAVVYVSVNTALVFVWLWTTGSTEQLGDYLKDPAEAVPDGFWPGVVMLFWGLALVIHAGAVVVSLRPARRRAKRQRHAEREARRAARTASRAGTTVGPRRQWTVVMFTDICRSTPLAEAMGDDAWAGVLADYRGEVRGVIDGHGGQEVGTQGDGFLLRFADPDLAVDSAIALQRRLASRRDEGSFTPEVRVGIHAGEAIDDEADLVGQVVNVASRVVDIAEPNEILVTEPVADQLAPGHVVVDRGLHELKGVTRARHLLAVRWDTEAETAALEEIIDLVDRTEAD